jgi:uncharacterized damage-inducible protein DinB
MGTDYDEIAEAQEDDGAPVSELIARYRAGCGILADAVAGLTPDQLHATPVAGKRSTQAVACHVVDADQYCADRMKRAIALDRPLLVGVDAWEYTDALHYDARDIELDLALLRVTREQMAADLERLEPETWKRTAVHSETGLLTLRQLLFHAIRHLEWHVATIIEKRAAMGLDS